MEKMLSHLCSYLAESGFAVDLLMVKTRSSYLQQLSPRVRSVPLGTEHTYSALPELVRYLKTHRPTALLAAKDRANQTAILARMMAKTDTRVVVRMGTTVSEALKSKGQIHRLAWALPIRWLYPKADAIVAVSRGVAKDLVRFAGIPEDTLTVVPNPVIAPQLFESAAAPISHPWFNGGETPVLVGMGRLTRQKDFPTLLRAFQIVRSRRLSRLVILGEGRDRVSLEALASQLGIREDVDLPGFVPNPYPFLRKASVFVLSSIWEGSPNALTEALALGTPVVATDCPSGPREILQAGRVAPLVPMRNPHAMAQAVLDMLDHPPHKERLQEAAAPYTAENSARRYLEVLLKRPI
nr:glycosyltransferase [Desulfacinum hydrothermale]